MLIHVILYILLCLYGLVFSILYDRYIVAVAVIVSAAMPVFSYVLTLIGSHFIRVSVAVGDEAVHKKEEFEILVTIQNKSLIPVSYGRIGYRIGYAEVPKAEWGKLKCNIPAGKSVQYRIRLSSLYTGIVTAGVEYVQLYDLFRIFRTTKGYRVEEKKLIYPKVEQLLVEVKNTPIFTEQESEEYYEDRPGNDPSQVFDIREYREGDRLQRIHWKLSGERDEILVKEFSEPVIVDTMVIFDLYVQKKGMDAVAKRSEVYDKEVSLSYTLIQEKVEHYVAWYDRKNGMTKKRRISSEEDLREAVYEMGMLESYSFPGFAESYLVMENRQSYSNLFYVGNHVESFLEQGIHAEVVK